MRKSILFAVAAISLVTSGAAQAVTLISAAVTSVTSTDTATGRVWDTTANSNYTLFLRYPVLGPNNAPVINPNDEPVNVSLGTGTSRFLLAGEGFFPGQTTDSDPLYKLTLGFLGGSTLTGLYAPTTNSFLSGSSAVIDGINFALTDFSFRRFGGDTVQPFTATPGADPNDYVGNFNITSAVPEPATWAMMLIGFGGIGYSMRRRRKVALLQAV